MEKLLKDIELRGDQQKKMEYQKSLNSLRDFNQPIENIEDLDEEEIPNMSEEVKNALKNQFKEMQKKQGEKGEKQGGEQDSQKKS